MMSQEWIERLCNEQAEAVARHQRYIAVHERNLRVLSAVGQRTLTEAQAIVQLEAEASSLEEPGLMATYRQTIERLRRRREGRG